MTLSRILQVFLAVSFPLYHVCAERFESGESQTTLLELYTSEGCSSCPPADARLGRLKNSDRLWRDFVPLAFHVDYWNRHGWLDRFSAKKFAARQMLYAANWKGESVYTLAFVLNGREWRQWSQASEPPTSSASSAGNLSATLNNNQQVQIDFKPAVTGEWDAHLALLGFEMSSQVTRGENSGRNLQHDFVVLNLQNASLRNNGNSPRAAVSLEKSDLTKDSRLALAVWVTSPGDPKPVQATGGWLSPQEK